jgi:hypothetical protein
VIAFVVAIFPSWPATAASCSPSELRDGTCNVSAGIGDGAVNLEGNQTTPGGNGGAAGGGGAVVGAPGNSPEDPDAECDAILGDRCFVEGPEKIPPAEDPADPVTLADIASFRPAPGVNRMEPDGWVVVGLDANIYSTGGIQVVEGTLLGQPAAVRFTPVRWHWNYGDGTSATRATPGATWQAQGLPEFSPTATSHIYTSAGTYYIDLDIDFAPEYRFAGGAWTRVPGTITLPSNRLVITSGDAKTVLVERECTLNPTGPGC